MVAGAGAVGVVEVEMSAEPIGGIIGIAQGIAVFVKEGFVPGESVVAEDEDADDGTEDEEEEDGSFQV